MCIHGEDRRTEDGESGPGKAGSIFANAASVLSMAAEEISLDDHLEKELANEVELWRMETTNTALKRTMHEYGLASCHPPINGLTNPDQEIDVPFQNERRYFPATHPTVNYHGHVGADGALGVAFFQKPPSSSSTADPTATQNVATVSGVTTPRRVPVLDEVVEGAPCASDSSVIPPGVAGGTAENNSHLVKPYEAVSPTSSESTFPGFFEDSTEQNSGEVHIWLGGQQHHSYTAFPQSSWDHHCGYANREGGNDDKRGIFQKEVNPAQVGNYSGYQPRLELGPEQEAANLPFATAPITGMESSVRTYV